jgi:hypothetical protein
VTVCGGRRGPGRAIGHTRSGAVLYEHMFVASPNRTPGAGDAGVPTRSGTGEPGSLALLAERVRPVSASQTRLLPVLPPLTGLFPDGGLRRGSTVVVTGPPGDGGAGGEVSLALALVAAASGGGSWCALVGLAGLGAVAAHDLGIDLTRLALVPRPGPAWAEVTAAAVDGVDLVVLLPPFPPRAAMARRLGARVRDRRAVLVVVPGHSGWPEPPDLRLGVDELHWDGVGAGDGYLARRRMTVTAAGRRSAARPQRLQLWLPSPAGVVAPVDTRTDALPRVGR